MATDTPSSYRPDIDGLRAAAVLLVVDFHAFPGWVPGGFVGVDVFFAISGYLISGLIIRDIREGSFSIRDFYARRIRRIFPALGVLLIACLLVGGIVLTPTEYADLGLNAAAGAAFVSNLALWAQSGCFAVVSELKPLLHLWSLGVEEQFYFAWPLTLVLLFARTKRPWTLVTGIALLSFALSLRLAATNPDAAFYSPLTRLWELLIGGLLAHQAERTRSGATVSQARPGSLGPMGARNAVSLVHPGVRGRGAESPRQRNPPLGRLACGPPRARSTGARIACRVRPAVGHQLPAHPRVLGQGAAQLRAHQPMGPGVGARAGRQRSCSRRAGPTTTAIQPSPGRSAS